MLSSAKWSVEVGDCREVMRGLADASVDAVVTDPPYELGFMGKRWDASGVAYDVDVWREALRVAKPGAFLLAFGGSRTYHRLTCAIEDAGWEIRDCIMWLYGSGFPKSHDVSKAIDKAAGAKRERIRATGNLHNHANMNDDAWTNIGADVAMMDSTVPSTDLARKWYGWGTALKPAHEPIVVARKPLCGTVAANFERHGCGGLNIDACRVGTDGGTTKGNPPKLKSNGVYGDGINGACDIVPLNAGRWPANVIHDGSEEVVGLFPQTTSGKPMNRMHTDPGRNVASGASKGGEYFHSGFGDSGSAARFFYCAKASKKDRGEGNIHATVKPTALMRWLVRLVTPPNGLVLDPFTGSGSTGKACALEGFRFVGIEQSAEYAEIARARIAAVNGGLFAEVTA